MTKTRRVATLKETLAVVELLKEHCHKVGDGCAYSDSMTDQVIADRVGGEPRLSVSTVERIRSELFGALVKIGGPPVDATMATVFEVGALNARLWVALELMWAELQEVRKYAGLDVTTEPVAIVAFQRSTAPAAPVAPAAEAAEEVAA